MNRGSRRLLLLFLALLGFVASDLWAQRGGDRGASRRSARSSVNQDRNVNQNRNINQNRDVVLNGLTYQQCGSTWYQPQFVGSTTSYVVVAAPK